MNLKGTKTEANLMAAFAGESQARNRYTFAASAAKKNGLYVINAVFGFTADQEKEHAEIFYHHLKELGLNLEALHISELYQAYKKQYLSEEENE